MITQTRFKAVLIGLALGLIEGVVKVAFPTFPIVETFGFQAAIVGAYLAARTASGIKNMSMGNGDSEDGEQNGKEIPSIRPGVVMVMEKPE
jgi:ribose/xylose/arabinose/galactoside ABC-type transport system permease subunit